VAQIVLSVRFIHAAAAADEGGQAEAADAHRREARRLLREAARGNQDRSIGVRIDFLLVWLSWEGERGRESTFSQINRFHHRYGDGEGVLLGVVWLIKGELEMEERHYQRAQRAFRHVLDQPGHPLYGYALFRTARCWTVLGEVSLGIDALGEVERLGCASDASPLTMTLSARAGQLLNHPPLPDMSWGDRRAVCEGRGAEVGAQMEAEPEL
jgi:hypothetical protein